MCGRIITLSPVGGGGDFRDCHSKPVLAARVSVAQGVECGVRCSGVTGKGCYKSRHCTCVNADSLVCFAASCYASEECSNVLSDSSDASVGLEHSNKGRNSTSCDESA